MSRTFDAIVFPAPGEVEIRSFELPPCGPEEVVVKTLMSMVSTGTEMRVWAGYYGANSKFPFIPGYSIIGEVVEVGADVSAVAVGDLVSGRNPLPVPGINQCWGAQAAYHRYLTTGYDMLLKLPAGVDPFDALIAEIGAISWRGVKHAGCTAGETALVNGQGLIGALAGKFLTMHGVHTVVTDVHPIRLERGRKLGAVAAVDARAADADAQIRAALGDGADILIEATGQPGPAKAALKYLRGRGTNYTPLPRIVFQANYVEEVPVNLAGFAPGQAVSLFYPGDREPEDRVDVLNFVAEGKISAREFVDQVVDYRDAPDAYQKIKAHPDQYFSIMYKWA